MPVGRTRTFKDLVTPIFRWAGRARGDACGPRTSARLGSKWVTKGMLKKILSCTYERGASKNGKFSPVECQLPRYCPLSSDLRAAAPRERPFGVLVLANKLRLHRAKAYVD